MFSLSVLVPPTIATENRKTSANEGQTATLRCEVDGNPEPGIKWYKLDSIPIKESDRVTITKRSVKSPYYGAFRVISILQIRDVVADDYGEYDCRASNPVGVDDFNITLTGKSKLVILIRGQEVLGLIPIKFLIFFFMFELVHVDFFSLLVLSDICNFQGPTELYYTLLQYFNCRNDVQSISFLENIDKREIKNWEQNCFYFWKIESLF